MDYEKEVGKLNEGVNVWKPSTGVHDVFVMAEPEETVYKDEESGKETPQIKLKVRIKNEEKDWYVGKGITTRSLYGQLMVIGRHHGKLEGQNLTLNVIEIRSKDGGMQKSYTITEALRIIQEGNITVETVNNQPESQALYDPANVVK